jgi:hypothetical protein
VGQSGEEGTARCDRGRARKTPVGAPKTGNFRLIYRRVLCYAVLSVYVILECAESEAASGLAWQILPPLILPL